MPAKVIKIRGNYSKSGRSVFSLLKVHGCPASSGGDCADCAASPGWECLAQFSEELNKASIPEDVDGQPGLHLRGQTVCCKAINFLKLGQGGTSPNREFL